MNNYQAGYPSLAFDGMPLIVANIPQTISAP